MRTLIPLLYPHVNLMAYQIQKFCILICSKWFDFNLPAKIEWSLTMKSKYKKMPHWTNKASDRLWKRLRFKINERKTSTNMCWSHKLNAGCRTPSRGKIILAFYLKSNKRRGADENRTQKSVTKPSSKGSKLIWNAKEIKIQTLN